MYVFADLCSGKIVALRDTLGEGEVREIGVADFSPVAIEGAADGGILIGSAEGGVYRLRLPADLDRGWRSANQLMLASSLAARRTAFGHSLEEYRRILRSRSWQAAQLIRRVSEWLP